MLDTFRKISNNFASKLLLALLVLSFAVWGIEDMVRGPGRNASVATVGKQSITLDTYQRALHRETENLRRRLGAQFSPELLKRLHIERQVLQSLVDQALLKQESEALGLNPSDTDIARRIRGNPAFQDAHGNFDKNIFAATLRNNGSNEKIFVNSIREELAMSMIMDTLTGRVPVSETAVETMYAAREEGRQATIYTLDASRVAAESHPDTAALQTYYDEHAHEFSAPEYRTVSYVIIRPEDARAKVRVSEQDILMAYKDRIDEFKRPERRTVEQLLYADEKDAKTAYDLLQSGKSVEAVAASTPVLNKNALSLGKVERANVLEAAAGAVFSLKKGEVTAPVKSPFGWHVFHVSAISPPSTASIDEVRSMLAKDVKQQMEEDAQGKFTNRLEDMLAGGSSLSEAAKEMGLKVSSVGPVTAEGKAQDGTMVKNIPDLDKFLETAFKTEEKTESSLIRSRNGVSYLVHVDQVMPERRRTLDEVRGLVTNAWQKATREKHLSEQAAEVGKKLADTSARAATIAEYHLSTAYAGALKRNVAKAGSLTLPPLLVADIFSHAPGESTNAYPLASGDYAVAVVGEKVPAPRADKKDLDAIRTALKREVQQEILEQYLAYLAKKYPISVNEKLLTPPSAEEE